MPTELAFPGFTVHRCIHWSVERLWIVPLGEVLHTLYFFINCSYVRAPFGHYNPEYTTYLNNNGHNKQNNMKKISFTSITLTQHYNNYWRANPMTINGLQKFGIGFLDHNMTVGVTLGPWVKGLQSYSTLCIAR